VDVSASDDIEVESSGAPVEEVPAPRVSQDAAIEATSGADEASETIEAAEEPSEEPKPKPRNSLQAKIDSVVAKQRQAERERDEYRAKVDAYERSQPRTEPEKREPQYTRPKPTEGEIGAKYADYPAYIEDLTDWKLEQRDAQQAIQARQQAVSQRHEANAAKFSEKIAKAEETDPDFWSKIAPHIANLRPSSTLEPGERPTALNAIADIIFDSEYSTELMAHFSAHAKEFQRLSTLPPGPLFREMGRLEARFVRTEAAAPGPAPRTPVVSQAPAPIKPVGTTASTGEVDPLSEDLDVDTHIRVMNARDRKNARR